MSTTLSTKAAQLSAILQDLKAKLEDSRAKLEESRRKIAECDANEMIIVSRTNQLQAEKDNLKKRLEESEDTAKRLQLDLEHLADYATSLEAAYYAYRHDDEAPDDKYMPMSMRRDGPRGW